MDISNTEEPGSRSVDLENILLDQPSSRYHNKLLDERRHLSFAITLHRSLRHKNDQKIQALSSRVHNLEVTSNRIKLQGIKYKLKLEKLYNAQGIDAAMFSQTQILKSELDIKELERKKACTEMKIQGKKKMEFSKLIHQMRLNKRVQSVKQQAQKAETEKLRATQQLLETNRQRYNWVKEGEKSLKDRAQKIEEFKLLRARQNYLQKIQSVLKGQREKQMRLRRLQEEEVKKLDSLKKTQMLRDESVKIEKYLESTVFTTQLQ